MHVEHIPTFPSVDLELVLTDVDTCCAAYRWRAFCSAQTCNWNGVCSDSAGGAGRCTARFRHYWSHLESTSNGHLAFWPCRRWRRRHADAVGDYSCTNDGYCGCWWNFNVAYIRFSTARRSNTFIPKEPLGLVAHCLTQTLSLLYKRFVYCTWIALIFMFNLPLGRITIDATPYKVAWVRDFSIQSFCIRPSENSTLDK